MQHPFQSLLSVPNFTETLEVKEVKGMVLILSSVGDHAKPVVRARGQFQKPHFLFCGTYPALASLVSFIHLFNKSSLGTCCVPGPVLSMGDAGLRRNISPCLQIAQQSSREAGHGTV